MITIFNLGNNLPTDVLYNIVEHFLNIKWLREDIWVDIFLRRVKDAPGYIEADTELSYMIRCIALETGVHRERHTFETRQRVSRLDMNPKLDGIVESIKVEHNGKTILDTKDQVFIAEHYHRVGQFKCFDYEIFGEPGSSTNLTLTMKRFIASGAEDLWDSRVPAKSIIVRVKFNPGELEVEALKSQPGHLRGRTLTDNPLSPKYGERENKNFDLIFECRPVLPLEGIIIRAHCKNEHDAMPDDKEQIKT